MDVVMAGLLSALIVLLLIQLLGTKKAAVKFDLLTARLDGLDRGQERFERALREELKGFRDEVALSARQDREERTLSFSKLREEISSTLKASHDSSVKVLGEIRQAQENDLHVFRQQLNDLTQTTEQKLEVIRSTMEEKLRLLQEDNTKQLDQIRATVDEKLQNTLEKRLGESFKQVSERLEQVHRGLGEMQTLATGVGDLKRVLTNVKTRGIWGEIQLGALVEQVLTPDQYARNVKTKQGSSDPVEFAIKLPGRNLDSSRPVWLPVDSKFPLDAYSKLLDAAERGTPEECHTAALELEQRVKVFGKDIQLKYLDPPWTTDFAIMFLPIEGLYAEVLRRPGLVENLQQNLHIIVAGPTTFAALLNSLQMGFRTLAIEKRSSEVWSLLGAVKTQFGKFGELLDKVGDNIRRAGESLDNASRKTKFITGKLKRIEELPPAEAEALLGVEAAGATEEQSE